MTDTAQLPGAAETDPNAQIDAAADAFKAFLNPSTAQPRASNGQFASTEQADENTEPGEDESQLVETGEDEPGEDNEAEEAAEQAQPMPPSWGADDAELWATLPPAAQARIAEREGERDRGLNLKLQETANARKTHELAVREVQTKRDDYLAALETVEALYKAPRPDPRAFGYGTQQYDAAAFSLADRQWQQNEQVLAQLAEQREAARKEAAEEEAKVLSEWREAHEAEHAPKLLADVPELKDAATAGPVLQGLVKFAIDNGIPESVFAEDQANEITSGQLRILWMAQQFEKLKSAPAAPKPKPAAGPAVKPGVSSPRSATKAARIQKAADRLSREGSVEAGAAYFRNIL